MGERRLRRTACKFQQQKTQPQGFINLDLFRLEICVTWKFQQQKKSATSEVLST